ncbi:hypothetical protein D3C80_1693380 [compost metagenome]
MPEGAQRSFVDVDDLDRHGFVGARRQPLIFIEGDVARLLQKLRIAGAQQCQNSNDDQTDHDAELLCTCHGASLYGGQARLAQTVGEVRVVGGVDITGEDLPVAREIQRCVGDRFVYELAGIVGASELTETGEHHHQIEIGAP